MLSSELAMQLAISATSLVAAWLIAGKSVWGQRLAAVSNILWWIYIIATQQWGLIPLEVGYTIVIVRALVIWERDEKLRRSSLKSARP